MARSRIIGPVAIAATVAMLSACAPTFVNHGYAPPEAQLALVQPGVDDKISVEQKIGRPINEGLITNEAWYYAASRVRNYTYNEPEVTERRLVTITFDEFGIVEDIAEAGLEDGRTVPLVVRTTPTFGSEISAVQQLLRNVLNLQVQE
ncbi:outer membrane protein assembly factor BamE (lipoprotein component of BamABCDE complex) [Rubricella aquisinus]|uniref:Outer membrane protein assembly factor BamE (Lipoprotein component of BamABCDE complex) n=1 Tax=Rubricella aquisinus TaxID=2028108 RepID=A0A840WMR5_9RHOB|nr:outer membrane protein assembly factor BamE [Rubricella aquisinus]MBB5516368.1 outer membrane protein assembly factor BamE (lipoprotein component of BamABCDE complex) [Rubricella aquisinus]